MGDAIDMMTGEKTISFKDAIDLLNDGYRIARLFWPAGFYIHREGDRIMVTTHLETFEKYFFASSDVLANDWVDISEVIERDE